MWDVNEMGLTLSDESFHSHSCFSMLEKQGKFGIIVWGLRMGINDRAPRRPLPL